MKNITKFNTFITFIYLLILSTTVHASYRDEDDRYSRSKQARKSTFSLMKFDEIEEVVEDEREEKASRRRMSMRVNARKATTSRRKRRDTRRNTMCLSTARDEQAGGSTRLFLAFSMNPGQKRDETIMLIARDRNISNDIRLEAANELPTSESKAKILRELRSLTRKSVNEYDDVVVSATTPTSPRFSMRAQPSTISVRERTLINQKRHKNKVALALNTSKSKRLRVRAALNLPMDHPMREGVLFQLVIEGLGDDIRSALVLPDNESQDLMLLQIALNRSQYLSSLDGDVGYTDLKDNVNPYVLNQLNKTFSVYARIIATIALSEDYEWHTELLSEFDRANGINAARKLSKYNNWRTALLDNVANDENINTKFRIIAATALPIEKRRLYTFIKIIADIKEKTYEADNLIKAKHAVVDTIIGFSEDNVEREEGLDRITKNSSFGTYRFKAAMAFPPGNVHRITGLRYLMEDPKFGVDNNIQAALLLQEEGESCTSSLKKLATNSKASEILRVKATRAMPKRHKERNKLLLKFAKNSKFSIESRILATIALKGKKHHKYRTKKLLAFAKKQKRKPFSFKKFKDIDINHRVMSTLALPKRHPKRSQLLLKFVDLILYDDEAIDETIDEENCTNVLNAAIDVIIDLPAEDDMRKEALRAIFKNEDIDHKNRTRAGRALRTFTKRRMSLRISAKKAEELVETIKEEAEEEKASDLPPAEIDEEAVVSILPVDSDEKEKVVIDLTVESDEEVLDVISDLSEESDEEVERGSEQPPIDYDGNHQK